MTSEEFVKKLQDEFKTPVCPEAKKMISEEFVKKLQDEFKTSVYPEAKKLIEKFETGAIDFYNLNEEKRKQAFYDTFSIMSIEGRDWYMESFVENFKEASEAMFKHCAYCIWQDESGEFIAADAIFYSYADGLKTVVHIWPPSLFQQYKRINGIELEGEELIKHYFDHNGTCDVPIRKYKDFPSAILMEQGRPGVPEYVDYSVFNLSDIAAIIQRRRERQQEEDDYDDWD